jgi:hypothetical protein
MSSVSIEDVDLQYLPLRKSEYFESFLVIGQALLNSLIEKMIIKFGLFARQHDFHYVQIIYFSAHMHDRLLGLL